MTSAARYELLKAVEANAEGTPYQVVPTEAGFDLRINVVDAHWSSLIGEARLTKVVENRVELDEVGRMMTITDAHLDVRWNVGGSSQAGGGLYDSGAGLSLTPSAMVEKTKGRRWEVSSRRTLGVGEGEPRPVGDFTFNSAEGHRMIRTPAAQLGWKEKAGTNQKIGMIVGGAALALAVAVGVALIILGQSGYL